jgi:hypothetical protein
VYQRVYERLLVHRHVVVLAVDRRLPVAGVSAYDVRVPAPDVLPTPDEAARFIREVEASHSSPAEIQREIDGWLTPPG